MLSFLFFFVQLLVFSEAMSSGGGQCSYGYYLSGSECAACSGYPSAGVYFPTAGDCSTNPCTNEPAGSYYTENANYGSTTCSYSPCSAGTYSTSIIATSCTPCWPNSYSSSGQSTCTCNSGFSQQGSACQVQTTSTSTTVSMFSTSTTSFTQPGSSIYSSSSKQTSALITSTVMPNTSPIYTSAQLSTQIFPLTTSIRCALCANGYYLVGCTNMSSGYCVICVNT